MIAALRRLRAPSLPVSVAAELDRPARRTRRLRLALALAALGLLAVSLVVSRGLDARATSYFAAGSGGIVVLDLSTSVDRYKYQRLQRVLRSLSDTGGRIGLVVFSDSAYEALPPGTRGEELKPLLPFFVPPRRPTSRRDAEQIARSFGLQSPWSGSFRGGTRISTGLGEARRIVHRDGIANPSVLLLSDLDDSAFDTAALTQELIRYEREGIDLRIVSLFAHWEDRLLFRQLVGNEAFVQRTELLANTAVEERQTLVGAFPAALVAGVAALLVLLAANERLFGRLTWRSPA